MTEFIGLQTLMYLYHAKIFKVRMLLNISEKYYSKGKKTTRLLPIKVT
jgi:hypothetical protein